MDLLLTILRFLFGMPADISYLEPILVRADGRTSTRKQSIASLRDADGTIEVPEFRDRFEPTSSGTPGGLRDQWSYFWRTRPRLRSGCLCSGQPSRN